MIRIPDPACLAKNAICAVVRASAYVILETAKYAVAILLRAFDLAQAAVSAANIVVDKARIIVELAKGVVDLAILSLEILKIAADAAVAGLELVKEAVKLAKEVVDFIARETIPNLVDARDCGFDLELSQDLTAFDVYCDINLFSKGWNKIRFTIDFGNVLGSIWNAAKAIIDNALSSIPNLFGRRKREIEFSLQSTLHSHFKKRSTGTSSAKANTTVFGFNNVDFWTQQCNAYQPILKFLSEGVDILRNITREMVSRTNNVMKIVNSETHGAYNSTQNVTLENANVDLNIAQEDFNLTSDDLVKAINQTKPEDDPVYRESKLTSEFILQQNRDKVSSILNFRIVPTWKSKMENVSKQIFNNGQCVSFYDCVIWAFGEIYQLVDSVESQLVYAAKLNLPDLERGYFELLSNETRGVVDVQNVSKIMLEALDLLQLTGVFCGTLPNITHHLENTTVIKGNNLTLKCYAQAKPFPTYHWYKNGERIASGKDMVSFDVTNINDSAIYSCVAGNHIGNSTASRAFVSVVFAPEITVEFPTPTTVLQNDEVTMACTATGAPQPRVEWHTSSTPTDRHSSGGYQDRLVIKNTLPSHSGIYMCKAVNVYGLDSSNEAILHVLQGKPTCPQLEVYVGYWTKSFDPSETVLHNAGIQPVNLEIGFSEVLKVLATDSLQFLVKLAEEQLIKVTVRIECKSVPLCTKLNCREKHNELVHKLERDWEKVREKLYDRPLLAIDDQMYFLNSAIRDVPTIRSTCQPGYHQFQEYVCVDTNGGYVLPIPVINNPKPSDALFVSWQSPQELEIFIKGYTVILMRDNSEILLNVTTNQTVYELPFSSTDNLSGYEIWIRVFTSSMHSAWANQTLAEMSSPDPDTDDGSQMDLILGLSIGLTSAVCLIVFSVVLIYTMGSKKLMAYSLPHWLTVKKKVDVNLTDHPDPMDKCPDDH